MLERPSQSPDLNRIETLLRDLKRGAHEEMLSNINGVKQWVRMSPKQCEQLVNSYREVYFKLLLLKLVVHVTELQHAHVFHFFKCCFLSIGVQ